MNTDNSIFSIKFFATCVVTFLITFGLSFLFLTLDTNDNNELAATDSSGDRVNDTEIAVIFFGCSTCPAALDDKIPRVLGELSAKLKESAISKGYGYILIGTSNEQNINKGLNYLNDIAVFDEVSLGNGMGNTTLQHYVWETFDHPLSAATPQIIISKRTYDTVTISENDVIHPRIISEEIMLREIGVARMERLLHDENFINSL